MSDQPPVGTSYIFTFPFPIFVDSDAPPNIRSMQIDGQSFRFYPFHRSAPENFVPVPSVDLSRLPFQRGLNVKLIIDPILEPIAIKPVLGLDSEGKSSLAPAWGGRTGRAETEIPKDSLRVDVMGPDDKVTNDQCVKVVRAFMQHLRCFSNQFWIEHFPAVGDLRAKFSIASDGTPCGGRPWSCGRGFTVSGDEVAISKEIWNASLEKIRNREEAMFYRLLILDARYNAVTSDVRRSIIDCASACEQARDFSFDRLSRNRVTGTLTRPPRIRRDDNLPKSIDSDLSRFSNGRLSYAIESPSNYVLIKNLWNARNSVAHGGPAIFRDDSGLNEVDGNLALQFVRAAEDCIKWLERI
jgi:hypothetical protein